MILIISFIHSVFQSLTSRSSDLMLKTFFFFVCFDFQNVFPGLWLVGITADAYRVADTPTKVLSLYILFVYLFCFR